MENIKAFAFLFCTGYVGILAAFWSSKNTQNQVFKIITLTTFVWSITLASTWINQGVWFDWFFSFPVILSSIFGLIFLFAQATSSIYSVIFKLIGLVSFVLTIIYFSI
jgi:hypothetical protein